ncbi:MAG: hypothetical protein Q9220_003620 [cf. Caloplaca sp. 1 TL-2023]
MDDIKEAPMAFVDIVPSPSPSLLTIKRLISPETVQLMAGNRNPHSRLGQSRGGVQNAIIGGRDRHIDAESHDNYRVILKPGTYTIEREMGSSKPPAVEADTRSKGKGKGKKKEEAYSPTT